MHAAGMLNKVRCIPKHFEAYLRLLLYQFINVFTVATYWR